MIKKIVCGLLCVVCGCSAFAQLADQLPDTLTKKKIVGSYIIQSQGSHGQIKFNGNYSGWKTVSKGKEIQKIKISWLLNRDTVYVSDRIGMQLLFKMVMHNGSLHFIRADGSSDPAALMTKKDYKFYQRQCKSSGH